MYAVAQATHGEEQIPGVSAGRVGGVHVRTVGQPGAAAMRRPLGAGRLSGLGRRMRRPADLQPAIPGSDSFPGPRISNQEGPRPALGLLSGVQPEAIASNVWAFTCAGSSRGVSMLTIA